MRRTEAVKPGQEPKHIEMTEEEIQKRHREEQKAAQELVQIEKREKLKKLFYDCPDILYALAVQHTDLDLVEKNKAIQHIKNWIDKIKNTDPNLDPLKYDKEKE